MKMKFVLTQFLVFFSHLVSDVVALDRAYARPSITFANYTHGDFDNLYDNAKDMTILSQYAYVHAAMVKESEEEPASGGFMSRKEPTAETIEKRLQLLETATTIGEFLDYNEDDAFQTDKEGSVVKDSIEVVKTDLSEGDNIGRTMDSVVVAFHASKEDIKKSCVWSITKHEEQKRIVVIFRGTSNSGDWVKDALIFQKHVDNPAKNRANIPDKIGIHSGFANALLQDEDGPTGYVAKIMAELRPVLEENPDHSLFITGHSLGGAMATLFGFFVAASDDDIYVKNSPVRVFSVSSPRVGDKAFRDSFKQLEEEGRVRHARIHNARDKVAMLPYIGGLYRHVGLEVKLRFKGLEPRLDYPRYEGWTQHSKSVSYWQQITSSIDAVKFHGCSLVRQRLKLASEELKKTTLENEYLKMWGLSD